MDSKSDVTLKFTAGVNRPIEVRSVRTDGNPAITCKATDKDGDAALNKVVKSDDYIAINCSRPPTTNTSGDKVYEEGVIQTAGNYGTYDVYLPSSQVVSERDATVIYQKLSQLENLAAGSADVAASVPGQGGGPGTNTAFLDFTDAQIHLNRTNSFKPGSPSYFLAPADGDYYVNADLFTPWDKNRTTADYFSFYLIKMSVDKNDWEQIDGVNDWSIFPRGSMSMNLHLLKGDKLAVKAGNASGIAVPMAGFFSVFQLD